MAQISPLGPLHFAHPSAMPSLTFAHIFRRSSSTSSESLPRSIKSKWRKSKSETKLVISYPIMLASPGHPTSTGAYESTSSLASAPPTYRDSCWSTSSEMSRSSLDEEKNKNAGKTQERTISIKDELEMYERERCEGIEAKVLALDAMMDKELKRMGL